MRCPRLKGYRLALFLLILALAIPAVVVPAVADDPPTKAEKTDKPEKPAKTEPKDAARPIEISDLADWKSVRSPMLSDDGVWFGYHLPPNDGDGEVVIRETRGDKIHQLPAGSMSGFGGVSLAFSDDSKWAAFLASPKKSEAKKLKKMKKPVRKTAVLVHLADGKKTEIEGVSRLAYSGKRATWIALKKDAGSGGPSRGKDAPKGSDLILRELASGSSINVGNVSEFAFNKSGDWLAWIIDAKDKTGNGVQLRNMATGAVIAPETDEASYQKLRWTEEGDALAVLRGTEDEKYEDPLFSVVAFTGFQGPSPKKTVFDPMKRDRFPKGMTVSPNRAPSWSKDLDAIFFGIHEAEKKKDKKPGGGPPGGSKENGDGPPKGGGPPGGDDEKPGIVIWHWKDKRLQSQQQVQESRDKNFSYLCAYRIGEDKFLRLADDELREVQPAPEGNWAIATDRDPYELEGNLDGRRYQDIYVIDTRTGKRRLALKKHRWFMGPSPEGSRLLYYQDGHYHTYEISTGESYKITENVPTSFINDEDDRNVVDPPVRPIGWTRGGASVLLYDNWDVWNVPAHGGAAANLTGNGKTDRIKYGSRLRLDPEEKGVDLTKPVFFRFLEYKTKRAGIARVDGGAPGVKRLLHGEGAYQRLMKAEKADVYVYTKESSNVVPEYFVAGADLAEGKRLTDMKPQMEDFVWSAGSRLVEYESAKGDKLQGALFLPANYVEGKSYPTVVYIYEKLSQRRYSFQAPRNGGFNTALYTSQGYAVYMPDITYQINDPGMSAVWCLLPAIEAASATGIVDPEKVGLQGHSWGGYQTAFLITQTDAFAAAVAGAPLTNLISMYSSIYWNSGSANQPIFESSQGRFTGGYWENLEAYRRNSPVHHATNVTTPLLLLHNDKDGAVDWNQGIEYFNTLRRLKKPVVMLQYKGENHGVRKDPNRTDYSERMLEFFDHYLKGAPAPTWLAEGIDHLDMEEHLEERAKADDKDGAETGPPKAKRGI